MYEAQPDTSSDGGITADRNTSHGTDPATASVPFVGLHGDKGAALIRHDERGPYLAIYFYPAGALKPTAGFKLRLEPFLLTEKL
jgi:hypothetical protein